jgi:hypothetical protein
MTVAKVLYKHQLELSSFQRLVGKCNEFHPFHNTFKNIVHDYSLGSNVGYDVLKLSYVLKVEKNYLWKISLKNLEVT